jgi:ornithine cyclodeaminase/alanine dehydrogenase-like protein (mu-crystallin family)
MLILSREEVRQALPMVEVIAATKKAYAALSAGKAEVPLRSSLAIDPHEATSLFMPAYLQSESGEALTVKIVSLFPHNTERDLPFIHAAVLVLQADTGQPLALLEGASLTAIRTGAASGAATDLLARPDSQVAGIFGAGVQSRTQLEAICTARSIQKVLIYDPRQDQVKKFIAEMAGQGPIPGDLRTAEDSEDVISQADIICCATTSHSPVFDDRHLKPGVHINGVGSYTPEMQEVPPETVLRAALIVDSRTAALSEAGDIIRPIKDGLITEKHIQAELGEIVLGLKPGRVDADQITFFKSVGNAVQDAAAAQLALENAKKLGLGRDIPL